MLRRLFKGLSLMEVMIALGLLGTVLVFVFTTLIGGLEMQKRAELVEQGSSLARRQLEALKSMPFGVVEGDFKGREGTATVDGFPPPPYPSAVQGREMWLDVRVVAQDERLWYVRISVYSEDRRMTSIESFLKR